MKKWTKFFLFIALPATMLTACDDDDDTTVTPPQNTDKAKVMVIHASPDAPGVDLLIDDTKVNSATLAYPNNTGYLEVNAGSRNVKVNAAGTATTVINANLNLAKDMNYSVFAANTLNSIEAVVLEDNLAAPASGKAHVRFVHLSPDAPAVDIAVTGGPVLFPNRVFKSATAFTPVDAMAYNLEVRLAGTQTVVLSVPNVQLTNGKIYTIFAKGLAGSAAGSPTALGAEIIVNK